MIRPHSSALRRALALATSLIASSIGLAACDEQGDEGARATVDSAFVEVLVDLHLADARGHISEDPALGDSLRDLVYEIHGTDSTQIQAQLEDLAQRPGAIAAFTEAVELRLSTEQHSTSPP